MTTFIDSNQWFPTDDVTIDIFQRKDLGELSGLLSEINIRISRCYNILAYTNRFLFGASFEQPPLFASDANAFETRGKTHHILNKLKDIANNLETLIQTLEVQHYVDN